MVPEVVGSDPIGRPIFRKIRDPGFAERQVRIIAHFMTDTRDTGLTLDPKFDRDGLITAVVTDDASGEVLMVAHMNAQALDLTVETGLAHFWSRSRQSLWKKGESSGHMLRVTDLRIDCDQDALWVKAVPAGPTCHTGARSCFFRRVGREGLSSVDAAD
ncbi:phosphoribosyl-AMP cyclohydrolase [Sphingobium amiense]|uniref:Phosphoribosyl-AMP cyclohydrolase n=2 Tax=Sphingobium amiense TaxID=135719 RepID=A0A494WC72_9SPHN|nr:phosphoribosyl-AMP cyclohydrolase [Sphingobium amiense]